MNTPPASRHQPGTRARVGRFWGDYRSLMLHQSPRFLDQLRRELAFCRVHPSIWVWGILLYVLADGLLVLLPGMDLQRANALALAGFTLAFLAFRQWRLHASRDQNPGPPRD